MHENLHVPLGEIRDIAARLGHVDPELRVAIRTGDTPPAERAAMRKHAPDLLVTTPESLYLLLTAPASRAMLRGVHTVIVDEVHTLARDKRGSHLALSLERLDGLVTEAGGHLQRIGLSATQRPLDVVARLLSGVHDDRPPTVIIDCGHARDLDVSIELPESELEAVASGGQFGDILDKIAAHTKEHRTTLIFVNTRKMAERVAHQLAERLAGEVDGGGRPGDDVDASLLVAAHHGSLSAARRRIVETPAAGRGPARRGGHRLARAGHRRRTRRAGLPDRVAPGDRHLPAAGRPGQPPARRDAGRPPLPDDA